MRSIHIKLTTCFLVWIFSGMLLLAEEAKTTEKTIPEKSGKSETPPEIGKNSTAKNLCPNGDFEEAKDSQTRGEKAPAGWRQKAREGWQTLDNLTSFYEVIERDGKKTHVLKIDTDVLEEEFHARSKELKDGSTEPAKTKTQVPPDDRYKTIGGTYGISLWTETPILVKKDTWYYFSAEFQGHTEDIFFPKIFLKGYGKGDWKQLDENLKWVKAENMAGEKGCLYETYLSMRNAEDPKLWKKYEMVIQPTRFNPNVEAVGIQIFAYWPRGVFRFDNIIFREATPEEVKAYQAEQERIKEELRKRKEEDRQKSGNAPRNQKEKTIEEIKE